MQHKTRSHREHRGLLMWLGGASPRRLWRNRQGSMAIEFAFVGPLFIVILMAVLEFGRMFWHQSSLQFAVEQVGRVAMAEYTRSYWADDSQSDSALATIVKNTAAASDNDNIVGWDGDSVTFSYTTETSGTPNFLVVTGTVNFEFLVPLIPVPDITLRARTRVPLIKSDA